MSRTPKQPATRLWGIVARAAPRVVIFRRGPTDQVMLLSWHTDTHEFFAGQWLKARVFERRCDLSPSGRKLIYFASDYARELATWTAVSRPPFFTAILLWPHGDSWGGGGLFASERIVRLNHPASRLKLGPAHKLPKAITVEPLHSQAGAGEDEPIEALRMSRDGWEKMTAGTWVGRGRSAPIAYENAENEVWRRRWKQWSIERRTSGMFEKQGTKYVTAHRLLTADGEVVEDFGRSDWCDWSYSGEVLLARDGRLWGLRISPQGRAGKLRELIDLRTQRFFAAAAPDAAREWGGEVVGTKIT